MVVHSVVRYHSPNTCLNNAHARTFSHVYASLPRLAEDENVPSACDIGIAIISSAENPGDDDNRHAPHRDNTAISIYHASLLPT